MINIISILTDFLKKDPVNYDLKNSSNGITKPLLRAYNEHRPLGPQKYLCYAPFKNLYFGHYGRAVACCYNRTNVLGTYPLHSIREIWFGKMADELRQAILNNDLSKGCSNCALQILSHNFDATKAHNYDHNKSNSNHYPSVMEFELDNTCNLECVMCNGDFSSLIRANREKRPPLKDPYDDAFIDQLKEFIPWLEEVRFFGGEPFLIDIYYKIWDLIVALNPAVRITVQTNATVLNSRVKALLEKTNFQINVSLDSLQKETYERIRVNANFDRVMENLKYFREYCHDRNTFFGVSACMMQQNCREMPDFIEFCNKMDVPVYFHTVFFPYDQSLRSLPTSQLEDLIAFYDNRISGLPQSTPMERKNKEHLADALRQLHKWFSISKERGDSKHLVNNMDEFILLIELRMKGKVTEDRIIKVTDIMRQLQQSLPRDFDYAARFKSMNLEDDVYLTGMFEYAEFMPLSQMLSEFQTTGS